MQIIKVILALSVIILSLTIDFMNTSIILLLLGALLLTIGAEEMKKEKKSTGILLIVAALFNLFVSIQDLILS